MAHWDDNGVVTDPLRKTQKLLVCSHERHMVRLIEVVLKRGGHLVVTAYDSDDAWQLVSQGGFDVLVIDEELPGRVPVADLLRAAEGKMRVIVLDKSRGKGAGGGGGPTAGADLSLSKPFDPGEMLAWIEGKD